MIHVDIRTYLNKTLLTLSVEFIPSKNTTTNPVHVISLTMLANKNFCNSNSGYQP